MKLNIIDNVKNDLIKVRQEFVSIQQKYKPVIILSHIDLTKSLKTVKKETTIQKYSRYLGYIFDEIKTIFREF